MLVALLRATTSLPLLLLLLLLRASASLPLLRRLAAPSPRWLLLLLLLLASTLLELGALPLLRGVVLEDTRGPTLVAVHAFGKRGSTATLQA